MKGILLGAALMTVMEVLAVTDVTAGMSVRFDGRAAELHEVRLSAVPFNQVWPGYQRPESQTKRGWFTRFDVERPGWLSLGFSDEGEARRAEKALRIRPLSRNNEIRRTGERLEVRIEGSEQFVLEFPGVADDVHVFADAPFRHQPVPGGRRFGPGVHEAGMITPKDGETIVFEPGAYVYGCLFLDGVKDVVITGRGTLDSSRMVRTVADLKVLNNQLEVIRKGKGRWDLNSSAFTAIDTENVRLEGITLVDAPFWTIILRGCRGTVVDGVKIIGQWRYNSDGIDVCYSADTVIRNCFIRSFDDCVVARGAQLNSAGSQVSNMLVEDCVLWCDWGKNLEVWGGDCPGGVSNVVYRRCKCVAVDNMACDVTVHGGRDDIVYDGISFEDIEIDVVKPLLAGRIQKRDVRDERYVPTEKESLRVLTVNRWGDQSPKKTIMRGISMKGIRFYGDRVGSEVVIDAASCPYVLEKVRLDIPPEVKVRRSGEQ